MMAYFYMLEIDQFGVISNAVKSSKLHYTDVSCASDKFTHVLFYT